MQPHDKLNSKDSVRKVAELAPAKKAASLAAEFKNFAFKGNVIDLAIGIIIGAAFGKIVDSLVKNIVMPVISLAMPTDRSYLDWKLAVGEKVVPYGLFLGEVVNFVIVTFALFIFVVKFLGWVTRVRKQEATATGPASVLPPKDEQLLTEIRDLLQRLADAEANRADSVTHASVPEVRSG